MGLYNFRLVYRRDYIPGELHPSSADYWIAHFSANRQLLSAAPPMTFGAPAHPVGPTVHPTTSKKVKPGKARKRGPRLSLAQREAGKMAVDLPSKVTALSSSLY